MFFVIFAAGKFRTCRKVHRKTQAGSLFTQHKYINGPAGNARLTMPFLHCPLRHSGTSLGSSMSHLALSDPCPVYGFISYVYADAIS